jgi:hypothetical protein
MMKRKGMIMNLNLENILEVIKNKKKKKKKKEEKKGKKER